MHSAKANMRPGLLSAGVVIGIEGARDEEGVKVGARIALPWRLTHF